MNKPFPASPPICQQLPSQPAPTNFLDLKQIDGSHFGLVEYHIGDAIDDGVLPIAVGTDEPSLHDMCLRE
jgi:hypothetical protein